MAGATPDGWYPPKQRSGLPILLTLVVTSLFVGFMLGGLKRLEIPPLLAGFFIILGILIYVFWPLHLHQMMWVSPEPEVCPVDLDAPDVPPYVANGVRETAEGLIPLGFARRGAYRVDKANPRAVSYVGLFEDRASGTEAMRIDVVPLKGSAIESMLTFSTRFADGTEVFTTNHANPSPLPEPKSRRSFAFPEVRDPVRLLSLHRRALVESADSSSRVLPTMEGAAARIRRLVAEEMVHQSDLGWFRFDEASDVYRLTYRGAFLLAWKSLGPWASIRRFAHLRRSRRLLRAWEDPPA